MNEWMNPHYGFVCGRHDAVWQPRSRNPQDWDLGCLEPTGWVQESLVLQQFNCCMWAARCASALFCWNKVVTTQSVYHRQQCDVIMTSWSSIKEVSKTYLQNFLLFNKTEITTCLADLFNSFCAVYAVASFKVVQQQTIGKVGNSIMCLCADNFCLQQWKNY